MLTAGENEGPGDGLIKEFAMKHENLSLDPPRPHKKPCTVEYACSPSV